MLTTTLCFIGPQTLLGNLVLMVVILILMIIGYIVRALSWVKRQFCKLLWWRKPPA